MPAGPIAHGYSRTLGLVPTAAVTPAEATAGRLTDAKLATIVETFSREGVVVLDAAMDHDALDQLRLFSDANIVRAATILDGPQLAPRAHPWVLAEIVANPIVEGVAAALLGESCLRWHRNFNV